MGALFVRNPRPAPAPTPADEATAELELPPALDVAAEIAEAYTPNASAGALPPASAVATSVSPSGAAPAPVAAVSGTSTAVEPIRYTTPEEARKLALLAEDPTDWTSPPATSRRATNEAIAREARMARIGLESEPEVEGFVPMEVPEIRVPDVVVPIRQTTLAYATARDMLAAFEAGADRLVERYRDERQDFDARKFDARTFANHLEALEIRWRNLGDGTLGERKYDDPAIGAMRGTLMIVVVQQRVFLGGYAAGLRTGDQDRIERSFRELALADEALARARAYVN
jgi:hypothetical protein